MQAMADFTVEHKLPGRLRVAVPALVAQKELTRGMKVHLAGVPGVSRVNANHYCGSITIYYDPKITAENGFLKILKNVTRENLSEFKDRSTKIIEEKKDSEDRQLPEKEKDAQAKDLASAADKGIWNPWNLAGSVLVGLGFIGPVVPLIPTVPPLLLAAYCYARGSPRFYNWLINHNYLGKFIRDYRDGKGISAKAKVRIIALLWASMGISIIFFVSSFALRTLLLLIGTGVTLHILRMKTAR
jgi:uncharacterized membrane protein YbaN (DUF454 family)